MANQGYDPMNAYNYGVLVEFAYQMYLNNLGNLTPPVPDNFPKDDYQIVLYLTAVDHILQDEERKFFGFLAQSLHNPTEYVVAVRGTEKLIEWLIDAEFWPTPFTPVPAAGDVEDGFMSIYATLTVIPAGQPATAQQPNAQQIIQQHVNQLPGGSLVIVGHSLGGALAELLALDMAVNHPVNNLTLYTLAAPKTGGRDYQKIFNQKVGASYRVYNEPDIVPKVPPLYQQVNEGEEIDSKNFAEIKHSILCYHELTTYLYVLNQQSLFGLGACANSSAQG
jgi:triacylglycerol lipase